MVLSDFQAIRNLLEAEQKRIADEILHYPPPIPRCDTQFNGLLEERATVAQALYDLDALVRAADAPGDCLAEFVGSARAIEGAAGRQIEALIEVSARTVVLPIVTERY